MVFFGRREDAVKQNQGGGAANNKRGARGKKTNIIPADDKWTLDFKKEYLDDLKKQAEESKRILEREKQELARLRGDEPAQPSGRAAAQHGGRAPPPLHVPNPSGRSPPSGQQQHPPPVQESGLHARVYREDEIPGLGGGGAAGPRPPPKGSRGTAAPAPAGAPQRRKVVVGAAAKQDRNPPPVAAQPSSMYPAAAEAFNHPPIPPQEGWPNAQGYPVQPPEPYLEPPHAQHGYGGAYGQPPAPPASHSHMMPPGLMPGMPMPVYYDYGPPSPTGGMHYHPNYGAAPYPMAYPGPHMEMYPPGPPGVPMMPSFVSPNGSHPPPHGFPPPEQLPVASGPGDDPSRALEGPHAPAFMAGLANMHGGVNSSERARREDARSAYVRELDEQVRLKKAAKADEERRARDYDARKQAEIAEFSANEGARREPNGLIALQPQAQPPSKGDRRHSGVSNASPAGQQSPPAVRGGDRAAHAVRGRKALAELRPGMSEDQQTQAAARNAELKAEWERQLADKKAAAERAKREEREREAREDAEIRAYHAKLAEEREREERRRGGGGHDSSQKPDVGPSARHGRRAPDGGPSHDEMMEALAEEEEHQQSGASNRGHWRQNRRIRSSDGADSGGEPKVAVYSAGEIPGLEDMEPSPKPPAAAWMSRPTSNEPSPLPRHEKGDRSHRSHRPPPRQRRTEGGQEGPSAVAGPEVSALLRELRDEQSALREHVVKHTESMAALKEQAAAAQADRERAQTELAAVRNRMDAPAAARSRGGDSLDHFIVETHIVPKDLNAIPDDLSELPWLDMGRKMGGGAPKTPLLRGAAANGGPEHAELRRVRERQAASPAILGGGFLPRNTDGQQAGRLGSKLGGPQTAAPSAGRRAKTEKGKEDNSRRWK